MVLVPPFEVKRDAKGGKGEYIDMALLDSATAAMAHYASFYLVSGTTPPRRGNAGNGGVPSAAFHCSDGMIMLTVGNDQQFKRFCAAIERPELVDDPRFTTGTARIVNRDSITAILAGVFATRPVAEWLDRLIAADIVAGPIYDLAQTFADPQVVSRKLEKMTPHPLGAELHMVANPIRFTNDPIETYEHPPTVGEHTDAVLRDVLGYNNGRIADLRRQKTI